MYGILISFTILISALLAEKLIKSRKIIPLKDFWKIILILIPSCIIGGRIYHVLDYFSYYAADPLKIFYIWQGGLGIFGALLFGFITVYLYSKLKKQYFYLYTDLFLFFVPVIQIAGRFGNYFNHELFGKPTNSIFGIFIPQNYRPFEYVNYTNFQPIFLYEIILNGIVFSYFVMLLFYKDVKIGGSKITSIYLISYGLIRIVLEPLRISGESFVVGGVSLSYIFSTILIIFGIFIIKINFKYQSSPAMRD